MVVAVVPPPALQRPQALVSSRRGHTTTPPGRRTHQTPPAAAAPPCRPRSLTPIPAVPTRRRGHNPPGRPSATAATPAPIDRSMAASLPMELCLAAAAARAGTPARAPPARPPKQRRATTTVRCAATAPAPMGQKTEYSDGPLERAFMGLFARKMEKYATKRKQQPPPESEKTTNKKKAVWDWDYESFVDVSRRVMVGRTRAEQQEAVREVLLSMLPPGAPEQFRKLFPPTRWACEFNAALTVPFFHWLVGPSEVIEVEVDGVKQKSGVLIKKCRYLENSGCVGMCINMCKIPTQDFFTNEFGLPLTMNPNFEDMSCEMIYGQVPPPLEEDPVSKQACYPNLCSMSTPSAPVCPKLQ